MRKTANLPAKIELYEGARFMLYHNIDLADKLSNGEIGTVVRILKNHNSVLDSVLFIKFDSPNAGNKRKKGNLVDANLRDCVPIKAEVKKFKLKLKNRTIQFHRKQMPGVEALGITVHKSQGGTYEFLEGDFNQTSRGKRLVDVKQGQAYTLLSRVKSSATIKLSNFTCGMIKVNNAALVEQERMRKECLFICDHVIDCIEGYKAVLLNIRSWNAHLKHFLSDPFLLSKCCLFIFTETNISGELKDSMTNYDAQWEEIHERTDHGLVLCFNKAFIEIGKQFDIVTNIEAMAYELSIKGGNEIGINFILIIVYRTPDPVRGNMIIFINELRDQIRSLPKDKRIMVAGDINIDQRDVNNVRLFDNLINEFSFIQRSQYTTHSQGGILDLLFDTKNDAAEAKTLPVPYSDHVALLFNL